MKQKASWAKVAVWLAALAMLSSAAAAISADVYTRFDSDQFKNRQLGVAAIDGMVRTGSRGQGLFLQFTGNFRGSLEKYPCGVYYRAVYLLYPRPVLIAEPGQVIDPQNAVEQIRKANFDPDGAWLLNHGVPRELRYVCSDSGEVRCRPRGVAPAGPSQ